MTSLKVENGVRIIPVVVHVIHNYGTERISENQVNSAIETMNNDFNALNEDISDVLDDFTSLVSDIGIDFRLAKIDEKIELGRGVRDI